MQIHSKSFSVRQIGMVNWIGLYTLFSKEVMRFINVGFQTLIAPMVSALLFLIIFKFAFGSVRPAIHGIDYVQFLIPGLIMMGMLNQSFANTASSLIISKVQGNSVDFLMPPLSAIELFLAFVSSAALRGLLVGAGSGLVMLLFESYHISHIGAVIWYAINATLMMAMIGLIAGIAGNRFDHLAAIQNFILLPLTMLSGTFYSITVLPQSFQHLSQLNPFFYLIDGFRYGFTGVSDGNLLVGIFLISAINLGLATICYLILASGWRLKS